MDVYLDLKNSSNRYSYKKENFLGAIKSLDFKKNDYIFIGEGTEKLTRYTRTLLGLKTIALLFFSFGYAWSTPHVRDDWNAFLSGERKISLHFSKSLFIQMLTTRNNHQTLLRLAKSHERGNYTSVECAIKCCSAVIHSKKKINLIYSIEKLRYFLKN